MPSTTYSAIRANMVALIEAVTPQFNTTKPFRLTRTELDDFREYADGCDQSVFREFEIEHIATTELGPRDNTVVMLETECELVAAYPHHWQIYAREKTASTRRNDAAMQATALQDRRSILRVIGREATENLVSGQHACIEGEITIETGEGVSFLVIPLTLTYYEQA